MQWQTRANQARCLVKTLIMSPGFSHLFRCTGTLQSRFLSLQRPRLPYPSYLWRGGTHGPGDRTERAALAPEAHSVLKLQEMGRPPPSPANTPSVRQKGVPT